MKDGRTFLKVKIKSLADESRTIRKETAKARQPRKNQLHLHRVGVVRRAARNAHVAYAFVRGRAYRSVEPKCETSPDWKEVRRLVKQYGIQWDYQRYPDFEPVAHSDYQAAKAEEEKRLEAWIVGAQTNVPV